MFGLWCEAQTLTEKGTYFEKAYVDNSCKNLVFKQILNFFLVNCQWLYQWLMFLELSLLSGLLEKTLYTNLTGSITAEQRAEAK